MSVYAKPMLWFGRWVVLACDGQCDKAWGINARPKVQLSDDPDDYESLADGELGVAPEDPGTYEGGHGKQPLSFNKWCARECERADIVDPARTTLVKLHDFRVRARNIPPEGAGTARDAQEVDK